MPEKNNLKTLEDFIDDNYGKKGSPKRDKFEQGYDEFKLGAMIQEARLEKGLTQEQLAEKCGTNKAYISKIENNIKDVRLSTLKKIIEIGLDGHLELSIKL
ncbi:MAG TPA: helix-turn-helix transcriptional regulator [Pyrinomonadaceae bacterium]|nr:helix-turn-helix transcriptional regulator [Pyrinomonadaceae bacterium]